ncbi:MAG: NADH:ubiquinone oxidoreductase [Pseudomonadota bacterium]
MQNDNGGGNCTLSSLIMAALVGVLATVVCVMFAGMTWTGSIFVGIIAAGVAAAIFLFVFCRELTPLSEIQAAREAAAAAPEAAPAPAPAPAPEPEPAPEPAPAPAAAPAPAPAAEEAPAAAKPTALSEAREGGADNLKEIKGIGPKLEKLCNSMGFYHFDQIAAWTDAEVAWVDDNLEGFKGRVTRDKWVEQAKILAAGGDTEFSKRVDGGKVY